VYSGFLRTDHRGRNAGFAVEVTLSVLSTRRKDARKVAKLARAFAALDREAGAVRPTPRRGVKLSLSG
jgi:hypothetical protein